MAWEQWSSTPTTRCRPRLGAETRLDRRIGFDRSVAVEMVLGDVEHHGDDGSSVGARSIW